MLFRACLSFCVFLAAFSPPPQAIAAEERPGDLCRGDAPGERGKSGVEQQLSCIVRELQRVEMRLALLEARQAQAEALHVPQIYSRNQAPETEPKP